MELSVFFFPALAAIILGVSKAGFGGIGTALALPVMVLGLNSNVALGALLPLLLATDVVSVIAHRKQMSFKHILAALPGAFLGILAGTLVIDATSPHLIAAIIGLLSIAFAVLALSGKNFDVSHWPKWVGALFGCVSGLTSTIAHAGGPPIHIFFLAQKFSPQAFVATSAGFMAGVNLLKVSPYLAIGAINAETINWSLKLAPIAIASAFAGVFLARTISTKAFKLCVNWLLILAGVKLLLDAFL